MNFRRRRRRLRLIVLGLATAALGASSAQATVIPYLSQGQGITAEQLAQLNAGTQSPKVIPYLSQGQGITAKQRAQLNAGAASGAFGNPAGTAPSAASERSLQSSSASIPCISVAGRCIEMHSKTVADSAKSVASRYDDHRGEAVVDSSKTVVYEQFGPLSAVPFATEAVAEPTRSIAGRYMDHRGGPVADSPKSSTGLNDRIHSRPLPSPADQQPSGTTADTDDGFNWSDAGVGAGSTLALLLLAGMAAMTIRRSRRNQLAGT
jgi:hypothetical protein